MDPDGDVIHVDSDHDDSDDEEAVSLSDCGDGLFGAPQQVFIVRALSKAMTGFRPSVMCEGFLAELSKSSSGYILAPLGREQQLSFKYEPPSPKFSRKRPSCVSYRLQLLHGSQFLYSLRGLPKVLRCQRSAHALEWGPVHLVFASAADLDKFLATMKYVDVEEMAPGQPGAPGAVGEQPRHSSGLVAVSAESSTHGDDGAGGNGAREGSSGGGMQWAVAAARLLAAEVDCAEGNAAAGDEPTATAGGRPSEEIPAGAPPLDFFSWLRSEVLLGTPFLAATAGAVVLVATVAAVLVSGKFRRGAGHSGKGV